MIYPFSSLVLTTLFSFLSISDGAVMTSRAIPSTISLQPSNIIKKTLGPLGTGGRPRTGSTSPTSFIHLQLNLCNSGFAKCYANGQSIAEGGELIYATGPNTVTINEVCSDNAAALQSYLREAWPTDYTYSVFMPATDRRTNAPYLCKSGSEYGSVILGRVAASSWSDISAYGGKYTAQDSTNEERIFACVAAKGDHFACTTHLSSSSTSIALAQGKALFSDAVPYLKGVAGSSAKTVVGGDFNLKYEKGAADHVQNIVPSGWTRKGDGDVQHVAFMDDLKFVGSRSYGLRFTDHPGWLVKLSTV